MLVEAKDHQQLSALTLRYQKYNLLILDELGYLPFSEWTSVFTDHRLCKALIDRIIHRAHIIETGTNSIRLEHTIACLNKINSSGGDNNIK